MFGRRWIIGLLAVVSATAACSSDTSEEGASFDYGRDEMTGAIEGTWEGASKPGATVAAGSPVTLTLTYSAADAHTLCNSRVLSNDDALRGAVAPRCIAISSMNVTGTLTSQRRATDVPQDVAVRGTFSVMSLRFTGDGDLQADIDGGRLGATLSNDVLEGKVSAADGSTLLAFELRRRK